MVFGWGEKKQVVEETRDKPTISAHKEVTLQDIPDIIQDVTNLRQKTLVAEVKSFQKRIESDRKTLLVIAGDLGKDNLKTADMDPHLEILVNRGKKEVISAIQNEFKNGFSDIDSFDSVKDFQRNASHGIKKVGDMLGKHTRVIHIFAKKYAKKLKGDLQVLTNNLTEVNTLISNYNSNQDLVNDINRSLNELSDTKKDITKQERRKSQLEESIDDEHKNEINLKNEIQDLQSSSEYKEFQEIQDKISSLSTEENSIKKKTEEQFIKISRPLNKYVYVSSLDKPLKIMIEKLASSPYDVLSEENESSIKTILSSVESGVKSGSVSVKDITKSTQAINGIQALLKQLITEKTKFLEKKSKLNDSLNIFDNDKLIRLAHDLEKSKFNASDAESKISVIQEQVDLTKTSILGLISKLELNLKQASSISYKISYNENDL